MELWREFFFEVLEKRYKSLQGKNPRFSQRALAKMAKVSSATMCDLLNQKTGWKLTSERALMICGSIGATSQQINRLAALSNQKVEYRQKKLSPTEYDVLLDSAYLTVLLSFDLGSQRSVPQLATCLHLSVAQVRKIIATLLKKNLLQRDAKGRISRNSAENWMTSDGIPNEVISQHHISNMKAMIQATADLPTQDRDVTSMTFAGDLNQLKLVQREIRDFHQRVHAIMDQGAKNNEVFKFVIGIAPMTKVEETKNRD